MEYHIPVMAAECMEALAVKPDGVYVDATFGGGGHSRLILEKLGPSGKLIAFDQDDDALANLPDDERLIFVNHNFRFMRRFLRYYDVEAVDGVFADLGVSSHQLDEGGRGFSYRFQADLDMRMNREGGETAADILNSRTAEELQDILGRYGEVRNARTLARAIADQRQVKPFEAIADLVAVAEANVRGKRERYLSQVFQALRIAVNDEMGALKQLLEDSLQVLKPGGRLVVLSYHSLEDRMVKNFLKTGNVEGEMVRDFYGNVHRPFKLLYKGVVLPSKEEVSSNPRARSAKMRAGEKV
ncbi:MAG: 16S rRNA (cytosine(1402)-N(4))-methyltransferase RsmH [Bacteroidetes bacterium]|nr:MAG: 16S rRNA (cytosine(1402)-N(4))-methyltransferase RsmH [Bacteroidota bacterium]